METVLITGAGGAATPALIRELKSNNYRVIAVDMSINFSGFMYADKSYIVPTGNDDSFLSKILEICKNEKVAAVIPCVDEELSKISKLESYGIVAILPNADFIELSLDKLALMRALNKNNILIPETQVLTGSSCSIDYPIIIKPRTGRGSRDLHIIKSKVEFDECLNCIKENSDNFIVQKLIEGKEYTVSVVVGNDGYVQAVIPKEIILKQGITKCAVTKKNEEIDMVCSKIQKIFKANGPFNVQLILDEKNNKPYIFEINPRFSTSVTLTAKAGVNEMILLLNQRLRDVPVKKISDWNENVVLFRETVDHFYSISKYKEIINKIGHRK